MNPSLIKTENQFNHQIFGKLTTIVNGNNDIFFISNEISKILEYSENRKMIERLDEDEIIRFNNEEAKRLLPTVEIHSSGVQLLTESGLYSAVLGSKKKEAKTFKKWITSEVLPSIRKTGSYSISKTEEDIILDLFPTTDHSLVKLVANTIRENKKQKALLIEQKPKVEFYDEIIDAKETFDMAETAKLLKLKYGRNTLFQRLKAAKVLMKDNEPYQQYVGNYFIIVESKWNNPTTGTSHIVKVTRTTQKGLDWLQKNKQKFNL